MTRHLAIVGPTAAGKSALALAWARALGDAEIVSLDSMQVYRGLDIGTAKPTGAERVDVVHHLVDVADPSEEWSVRRTRDGAQAAIAAIEARGRRALFVGGTGLYVRAVVDDLEIPPTDAGVRAAIDEAAAGDSGLARAYAELTDVDPAAAARMEPGNRRRIVRALEVIELTGRPFSSFGPGIDAYGPPAIDVAMFGITVEPTELARRIEQRFAGMRAAGLVEEVRELAERPMSRTAREAIGYREVLDHLAGDCSLDDALDAAVRRTRRFARRQRSWFQRDPRVQWIEAGAAMPDFVGVAVMSDLTLVKLHATGNDFLVYLALDANSTELDAAAVAVLCNRHTGIGADGLITITPGADGADCTMSLRNADGGLAEMSGNGARCLAWVADRAGLAHGDELVVDTGGGRRHITLERDATRGVVAAEVDMGAVTFEPAEIPLDAASAFDLEVAVEGVTYRGDAAGIGNPHLVLLVDDPSAVPVTGHGPQIEHDPRFPRRVNVEFVAVVAPDRVTMRVWERGAGETQSCGTGACATAAVTHRRGLVGERVAVDVLGGTLTVTLGSTIRLGGPVVHVFDVALSPDVLRGAVAQSAR